MLTKLDEASRGSWYNQLFLIEKKECRHYNLHLYIVLVGGCL